MSEVIRNEKGQFVEGSSGNPGGRPIGQSITQQLRKFMWEIDAETGTSKIEHKCIILWSKAIQGDLRAIGLIMDRIEGRPKQRVETDEPIMQPIRLIDRSPVSLILKDKDGNEMKVDKDELVVEVDSFLKEDYKKTS